THKLSSGGRAESRDGTRNQYRGRRLLKRLVRGRLTRLFAAPVARLPVASGHADKTHIVLGAIVPRISIARTKTVALSPRRQIAVHNPRNATQRRSKRNRAHDHKTSAQQGVLGAPRPPSSIDYTPIEAVPPPRPQGTILQTCAMGRRSAGEVRPPAPRV